MKGLTYLIVRFRRHTEAFQSASDITKFSAAEDSYEPLDLPSFLFKQPMTSISEGVMSIKSCQGSLQFAITRNYHRNSHSPSNSPENKTTPRRTQLNQYVFPCGRFLRCSRPECQHRTNPRHPRGARLPQPGQHQDGPRSPRS